MEVAAVEAVAGAVVVVEAAMAPAQIVTSLTAATKKGKIAHGNRRHESAFFFCMNFASSR